MENGESDIVVQVGYADSGKAQLQIVKEQRAATHGKSSERVARPCLIQSEAAMGTAAAHIEALGQRDQSMASGNRVRRAEQNGVAKRVFQSHASRTREYPTRAGSVIAEKRVIGRILDQSTAEIGFGAKVTGGHAALERGVATVFGFQIVVAPVAYKEKIGLAHSRWL